jgi:hypothetical protein
MYRPHERARRPCPLSDQPADEVPDVPESSVREESLSACVVPRPTADGNSRRRGVGHRRRHRCRGQRVAGFLRAQSCRVPGAAAGADHGHHDGPHLVEQLLLDDAIVDDVIVDYDVLVDDLDH